jgi:hypothetical protein
MILQKILIDEIYLTLNEKNLSFLKKFFINHFYYFIFLIKSLLVSIIIRMLLLNNRCYKYQIYIQFIVFLIDKKISNQKAYRMEKDGSQFF